MRKTFFVDAVQVTRENMQEIATWCGGEVARTVPKGRKEEVEYVKVRVFRPLNERQTMAFKGDWVLYAGTGYKVYSDKAFKGSFEQLLPGNSPMLEIEFAAGPHLSDEDIAHEMS
jgi:hypothetical protein